MQEGRTNSQDILESITELRDMLAKYVNHKPNSKQGRMQIQMNKRWEENS